MIMGEDGYGATREPGASSWNRSPVVEVARDVTSSSEADGAMDQSTSVFRWADPNPHAKFVGGGLR